jgi:muconate cycloisomerase
MTVTIDRVETVIIDVPTTRPHMLAMATMHVQTIVLVFLHRTDGVIGVGEATTIGGLSYGPEAPETMRLVIDRYVAPLIVGMDADRPAVIMDRLNEKVVGNRFVKCAIETALLDAIGLAKGLSVSTFLGGQDANACR